MNFIMQLEEWSERRDEVEVYTGAEFPTYTGFIIHVGEDYLAMGHREGRNIYDAMIPIDRITLIRVLVDGTGTKEWTTPKG